MADDRGWKEMMITNKDSNFTWFPSEKKGVEKLISIWWFFVLFIVGTGIVLGVMIYYSAETSVKKVEAEILNQRIFDCITNENYLNPKVFENNFEVFDGCGFNSEVFGKGSFFYFKILIYNETGLVAEKNYGDFAIDKNCKIAEKMSAKRFPECFARNKIVFDEKNKEIKLVVLTASNQEGERVSTI